jgi:hypothetical protein
MNDFLNPKSMMTPGAAGALVMFLSNAVCFQFPELSPRWAGLILSLLMGSIVVTAAKLKPVQAAGFGLINSLIIFAVAFGSAGVASKATNPATNAVAAVFDHLIAPADAQSAFSSSSQAQSTTATRIANLQAQLSAALGRIQTQQAQLATAQRALATEGPQSRTAADTVRAVEAQQGPPTPMKASVAAQNRFFKEW